MKDLNILDDMVTVLHVTIVYTERLLRTTDTSSTPEVLLMLHLNKDMLGSKKTINNIRKAIRLSSNTSAAYK